MAARRGAGTTRGGPARKLVTGAAADLDAFVTGLAHPLEQEIRLLRTALLAIDGSIREEIKWNSVSFRNEADFFATIHLRSRASLQLVLHAGAKRKPTAETGIRVEDPAGLIERWLTRDRCLLSLGAGAAFRANRAPLAALVRAWLRSSATAPVGLVARSRSPPKAGTRARPRAREAGSSRLLAGGNPQIAKADGDAPVQQYLAALPGWKREIGRRLDALVVRNVPDVRKAVKWNSPFYGVRGQGWFLAIHTFTHHLKVAFFRGAALRPVPPGASQGKDTRYLDIREGEGLDEAQLTAWVKQSAALPGWAS